LRFASQTLVEVLHPAMQPCLGLPDCATLHRDARFLLQPCLASRTRVREATVTLDRTV
jgi:hypothetical protein